MLDLLKETSFIGTRNADMPMEINLKLHANEGEPALDRTSREIDLFERNKAIHYLLYQSSKLIMKDPKKHVNAAYRIFRYLQRIQAWAYCPRAATI